jgi:excinuclease ABC subunit C
MSVDDVLKQKIQSFPGKPGVYIMKDAAGHVIYVGKAVSLADRIRSYFQSPAGHTPKTRRLVENIADLEFIVTDSELEALILEANLIKKHRPRYNVRLKDDKQYPYVRVRWAEDFPRIDITRHMYRDGSRYYGPFTASWAVYETLDLLRRLFPYRTCSRVITGHDPRPCLYYHIKRCSGPCIGAISKENYRATIDQVCQFLEGKTAAIERDLTHEMGAAAERLDFEEAARVRDQLQAIGRVAEQQKVVSKTMKDQDVIAFARANGDACVQVFFIRYGKLVGREYFTLEGAGDEDEQNIMAAFLKQFYNKAAYVPSEILLPEDIDEAMIIRSWLESKRGAKVQLVVPRRGHNRELVQMATENAVETLTHLRSQWLVEAGRANDALAQLQSALGLPRLPNRIECYDISNIQGTAATASMVVFENGAALKSDYRRFRIATVQGQDDFAMLQETLYRRFKRMFRADPIDDGKLHEESTWKIHPDLMIIDGGKGQLSAVLEVARRCEVTDIPIVGLAKQREEIFLPDQPDPILLPRGSQALFLVQRIRDEAHRFALEYHRKLRDKSMVASILDDIAGVGPKRRQALLRQFGSVEAIAEASVEELAVVAGMTRRVAERLKTYF